MQENNRHFSSNHSMIRCLHLTVALGVALALAPAAAADLACDLSQYKPADGLSAKIEGNVLALTWRGERDTELRLGLGIDNGHPIVAEMAVRPKGGAWSTLASNLSPRVPCDLRGKTHLGTAVCGRCAHSASTSLPRSSRKKSGSSSGTLP